MSVRKAALFVVAVVLPVSALSQYISVDITPPGFSRAVATAFDGEYIYGFGTPATAGGDHAIRWNADGSIVDIHPYTGTFSYSGVMAAQGGSQVGVAYVNDEHAAVWYGTKQSFVDLQPPSLTGNTYAYGVYGNTQVGVAHDGGADHARMWHGSAASMVSLEPPEFTQSCAYGVYGTAIVGFAYSPQWTGKHAVLWAGDASAWTDLHPEGFDLSSALAVWQDRQAGWVCIDNPLSPRFQAALWNGSPGSFVNLHPTGWYSSQIRGLAGPYQVGWAQLQGSFGSHTAFVWSETSTSAINLDDYAPPFVGAYEAWAVNPESGNIVGYGDSATGLRAILWKRDSTTPHIRKTTPTSARAFGQAFALTVAGANYREDSVVRWNGIDRPTTYLSPTQLTAQIPETDLQHAGTAYVTVFTQSTGNLESNSCPFSVLPGLVPPSGLSILAGNWISGGLPELINSDNQCLVGSFSWAVPRLAPNLDWQIDGVSPASPIAGLNIRILAEASLDGLQQRIELFNVAANRWDLIDTSLTTTTKTNRNVAAPSPAQNYVGPGGIMKCRVNYRPLQATPRVVTVLIDVAQFQVSP